MQKIPNRIFARINPETFSDIDLFNTEFSNERSNESDIEYIRVAKNCINASDLIDIITNRVCELFGTTIAELESDSRLDKHVRPRQVWHYLLYKYSNLTMKGIGFKSNRDHTTVRLGCSLVRDLLEVETHDYHIKYCRQIMMEIECGENN